MTLVHFNEAVTHLMQFLLRRKSTATVLTLMRWGGWSSYHHMCRSF